MPHKRTPVNLEQVSCILPLTDTSRFNSHSSPHPPQTPAASFKPLYRKRRFVPARPLRYTAANVV